MEVITDRTRWRPRASGRGWSLVIEIPEPALFLSVAAEWALRTERSAIVLDLEPKGSAIANFGAATVLVHQLHEPKAGPMEIFASDVPWMLRWWSEPLQAANSKCGATVLPVCLSLPVLARPGFGLNPSKMRKRLQVDNIASALHGFALSYLAGESDTALEIAKDTLAHLANRPLLRCDELGPFAAIVSAIGAGR